MSNIPYWPENAKGMVKFVCHNFVYAKDGEEGGVQLTTEENVKKLIADGFMSKDSELLFEFEAGSWVEAMQEYNRRLGHGPYVPMGIPKDK
jgi:hypothetical protein